MNSLQELSWSLISCCPTWHQLRTVANAERSMLPISVRCPLSCFNQLCWYARFWTCLHWTYVLIRVGWYWNWDKSTPGVCYIPFKSNENERKKCFDPVTASSLVKTFWVMHYIEVQKLFFHNMGFMGIKRCRILRRFQKYKLVLKTKCT
jgi:hypothetical protein